MGDTFVLGTSTKQQATSYLKALEDITHQGGNIGQGTANRSEINPTLRIAEPVETVVHDRPNGVFTLKKYIETNTEYLDDTEVTVITYGIKVVNDARTVDILGETAANLTKEDIDGKYCGWINLYHIPVATTYFPCVEYRISADGHYVSTEYIVPEQTYIIFLRTDIQAKMNNGLNTSSDVMIKTSIVIGDEQFEAVDSAHVDFIVLGSFSFQYLDVDKFVPHFEITQDYTVGREADVTEGRWWY